VSDTPESPLPDKLTAADLAGYGLTPDDVRRRCPWAVEYTALDGSPCWRREDLADLLDEEGGGL
jgi:hypothetical protein